MVQLGIGLLKCYTCGKILGIIKDETIAAVDDLWETPEFYCEKCYHKHYNIKNRKYK